MSIRPRPAAADAAPAASTCADRAAQLAEESLLGCARAEPTGADLARLGERQRAEALAALTARFAASYLRAIGSRGSVLSYPRVRVLEVLAVDGPAIMRDLADALGTTPRNITAIVDALEDAGLVLRMPHPEDRRATVVEITDHGRAEVDGARCHALERVVSPFAALSAEEQQRYADLLGRLIEAFCR